MDIPRLYKVSALPASPTPADDGVYFVRPNPSVGYICYIITNGVAVQQDAVTTAALTTLLGDYVKKAGDTMQGDLRFPNNAHVGFGNTNRFEIKYSATLAGLLIEHLSAAAILIKDNHNVGIDEPNPQARLHVNGNAIVSDATANNHAVTLGQVNLMKFNWILYDGTGPAINPLFSMLYDNTTGKWTYSDKTQFKNWLDLSAYALLSQVYTQSQALVLFVGLNGVQTIADTKTFTSSPIVPNGTLSGHTVNLGQVTTLLNDKVDKVADKQLSTEDYTSAEKIKLSGIQAGAEVNVNADWNATSGDAQILNKPTIPTGFAPNPHLYDNITVNSTVIDVSEFRRAVIVFSDPSVTSAALSNNAYTGTVVTLQTTSVQVDVTMDYRKPTSSGAMLPIEAYKSVQVSYSQDQNAWIVEQDNSLS